MQQDKYLKTLSAPGTKEFYDYDGIFERKMVKAINLQLSKHTESGFRLKSIADFNGLNCHLKLLVFRPGKDGLKFTDLINRFEKTKIPELAEDLVNLYGYDTTPAIITVVDRTRVAILPDNHYKGTITGEEGFFMVVNGNTLVIGLKDLSSLIQEEAQFTERA